MKHLGMRIDEIYKLPVTYRLWFIDKLIEGFKSQENASRNTSRGSRTTQTLEVPFGEMGKGLGGS